MTITEDITLIEGHRKITPAPGIPVWDVDPYDESILREQERQGGNEDRGVSFHCNDGGNCKCRIVWYVVGSSK